MPWLTAGLTGLSNELQRPPVVWQECQKLYTQPKPSWLNCVGSGAISQTVPDAKPLVVSDNLTCDFRIKYPLIQKGLHWNRFGFIHRSLAMPVIWPEKMETMERLHVSYRYASCSKAWVFKQYLRSFCWATTTPCNLYYNTTKLRCLVCSGSTRNNWLCVCVCVWDFT